MVLLYIMGWKAKDGIEKDATCAKHAGEYLMMYYNSITTYVEEINLIFFAFQPAASPVQSPSLTATAYVHIYKMIYKIN